MVDDVTVHLIEDNRDGESRTWCGVEFQHGSESLNTVTCKMCLRAVLVYADGAEVRLRILERGKK